MSDIFLEYIYAFVKFSLCSNFTIVDIPVHVMP